ncbi:hypothetical protein CW745_12105 [Psychromonas sp. psych-6C06]|uniref:translocation/assembly module TamB domain-containing protein n=1 Tax=Psychromonas sp. psych-6C06 TaxID=2058089 RepID=UPI000C31FD87|nr:translocation/assembly module TamB domain-containing protein [Psychromonas sp. psych-6C06]PKF61049.1 hypothetical protein CW745_12105 [Psychromonas sp. psych-6C06]
MTPIKFILKGLKVASYSLIAVLITTIVLLTLTLFTHPGNLALIKLAQHFESRLTLELAEGSVLRQPVFKNISWIDADTSINIKHIGYQFNWSCLVDKFCLQQLTVDGVTVKLPESNESNEVVEEGSGDPLVIDIPIALEIGDISISNVDFSMGGLNVVLNKISLQANAVHNDLSLASQISGLLVTLPDSEPVVAAKKVAVNRSKKRIDLDIKSLPAILTPEMLPTVQMPINLDVKPIKIDTLKIIQNEQSLFELNSLSTAFTFYDSKLNIDDFSLDIPETTLALTGNINFIDDYPLALNIDGEVKSVKQLQPKTLLKDTAYSVIASGSLSNLSTALNLSNTIELQLATQLNLFAENLPHEITLHWQDLQWPLTGDAQYSAKEGSFSSKGSLLDYQINLQSDFLAAGVPPGAVDFNTSGDLKHLQIETLNIDTLSGNIDFSGLLTWQEKIDWLGDLSIKNIDLTQLHSDYQGSFSGDIQQKATVILYEQHPPEWQFDFPVLEVVGQLLERPLSLTGRVSGNDKEGVLFDDLAINNAENSLIVNGQFAEQSDLNIVLNIADISHTIPQAHGNITGTVNVTGPNDTLTINSQLMATTLQYADYQLEQIGLDTALTLSQKPKLNLSLKAEKIHIEKQLIDDITLNIEHQVSNKDNVKHEIKLLANSELLSTDLLLFLTQTDTNLLTQLSEATIGLPHQSLNLLTPFDVLVENERIEITPHCWQATSSDLPEAGQLCAQTVQIGESGNVVLTIDRYQLASLSTFLPPHLKMQGAITADADIKWLKDNQPDFDVSIFTDNMLLQISADPKKNSFNDYPMEHLNIKAKGAGNEVDVNAVVFAQNLIDVKIEGQLQPYQSQPSINASIAAKLPDFSLFLPLVPALEKLQGQLDSDIKITGLLHKPSINGKVNVLDGQIAGTGIPMNIDALNADIKFDESKATLHGSFDSRGTHTVVEKTAKLPLLSGTINIFDKSVKKVSNRIVHPINNNKLVKEVADKNEGHAFLTGQLDWSNKLKGDIHIYANKLEVYDYGKLDLLISPDMHIVFADHIKVNGELLVNKGKVVVKELPAGAVSTSPDIIVVDVEHEKVAADLPVILDLGVDLGTDFQVIAVGLDTFIEGKLLISKPLKKDLNINGVLHLNDGSYRALGQQLVLRESRVIFQGAPESPNLQIEAIRDPNKIEDDVVAGVRVTGTPDELELVIFSEPAMAQQQALSYLTRGQALTSSSEGSTMANMLIDLAAGQSDGVMSTIGEEIGIKDLTLASSGTGDEQSVGIRGEIAPGIELSYGVGVFDNFSILSIRYEILERLYLEASSGIYQAVDAYYEWDWD